MKHTKYDKSNSKNLLAEKISNWRKVIIFMEEKSKVN